MDKFNVDLKNWLNSLSRVDKHRANNVIVGACQIKRRKLYNWLNAGTKIEPIYQSQINKVRANFVV